MDENIVHVPPGTHVVTPLVGIDLLRPWKLPPPVHFPVESEEERLAPSSSGISPLADICVVLPVGHIGQAERWLFGALAEVPGAPVNHRNGAARADGGVLRGLEGLECAIHHPWLTPMDDRHLLAGLRLDIVNQRHIERCAVDIRTPVHRCGLRRRLGSGDG